MAHAVVAGGGIGGLAAAVGLRRAGWDVTVLERSADTGPDVGAGIGLWPNALAALHWLGIGDDVIALGSQEVTGGLRTPRGRWLAKVARPEALAQRGLLLTVVHRAQLHRVLAGSLPAGTVRTAVEVSGASEDGTVRTSAGDLHADLVVAADGVRSAVAAGLGRPAAAYAGFTAWRGVTDEPADLDAMSETWTLGGEFGLTRMADGRVYWFATANLPEGTVFADERAELLRRFGTWHAPVRQVIDASSAILHHDILELRPPLRPFHAGRIALLGDAAHAMTPNLGQGGCQALEDAVTLAICVRDGRPLHWYDEQRRPRAQQLLRLSARAARLIQTDSRLVAAVRDLGARAVPASAAMAQLARITRWAPPDGPA
jgi:2-polyprenyl-6-methoxyphenol hydroxylase-like FAD-dependent oxidoreductase